MSHLAETHATIEFHLAALTEAATRIEAAQQNLLTLIRNLRDDIGRPEVFDPGQFGAGFKCRDVVRLLGRDLFVNGRRVGLSKCQAVLIAILIRHA